jgi:nitroimidazol reductase NimA-like FMN-containing flavoprotein (pyridoxamine 5'-phosphate oxidase superfamily)
MSATDRTKLRRYPERGSHEREVIDAILDEALVSHLGFADAEGRVSVVPTLHARDGDHVYVHGSAASRYARLARRDGGIPVCLTTTLIDGVVLARSAFHHSINYRSVVLYGDLVELPADERPAALERFTEQLVPGRWADIRPPTENELKASSIMRLEIDAASAKVRSGPPGDDEPDYALDTWAGVVPLRLEPGEPEADPRLRDGIERPAYVDAWAAERRR